MKQTPPRRTCIAPSSCIASAVTVVLFALSGISQTIISQKQHPADSSKATVVKASPDSSSLRADSAIVYTPPPSWGSLDSHLHDSWVFTRASLSWQPVRTFVDAFRSISGFILQSPESEGQYAELFARGIDARSVGFLVNGRPAQDPVSGIANPYHYQWMDCDRAEIITGPRSILYGLNSQGAVINLVSKDFNAIKPYSRIVYAEGPANFSFSDGTFVQNISRRVNLNAGFQHLSTDGVYPNSLHDQWNIRGRVRYHLSEQLALMVSGQYLSTQTGLNGGIDLASSGTKYAFQPLRAVLVNTDAYEKLTRSDLDLALGGRWHDSTAIFRASLYTSRLLREYRDEENRASPNGVFIQSDHESRWSGITARQEISLGRFSVLAGVLGEVVNVRMSPNLGTRNESHSAFWGKGEAVLYSGVRGAVYGRVERVYGIYGAGIGGDLEWPVTPQLTLFGGISRSDRIPNLFERFWTDSTVARSSPSGFAAEHHTHAEAGFEIHPSPSLLLRTTLFHRIIENPIELLEGSGNAGFPGVSIVQGGESSRQTLTGLEANLSLQIWYVLVEGAGTYIASVNGGVAPPERLPRVQARGGVYLRGTFLDGSLDLKTGVRGTVTSSFLGDRFNGETLMWVATTDAMLSAWSRADFVVTARIGDARLDFVWENLTNVQTFSARYYALPERGIWFRLCWEFLN